MNTPVATVATSSAPGAEATLASLQADFARALCSRASDEIEGLAWRLAPRPDGSVARFDVYRHAYRARLVSALRDNFEVLVQALGDEAFDALAAAYVQAHPPTRPSIRWYGHALADFMAGPGEAWVSHPALVDLARMDWALRQAFDAADAPVLGVDNLRAVAPPRWAGLRFVLHPSVQLLPLEWQVEPAWRALRAGLDRDAAAPGSSDDRDRVVFIDDITPEVPEPPPGAHVLLVWRRGLHTQWRSLAADEAAMLCAVAEGVEFAGLCELAQSLQAEVPAARAAGLLQRWVADELISEARLPSDGA